MNRQLAVKRAGRTVVRGLRDLFGIVLSALLGVFLGLVVLALVSGLGWL